MGGCLFRTTRPESFKEHHTRPKAVLVRPKSGARSARTTVQDDVCEPFPRRNAGDPGPSYSHSPVVVLPDSPRRTAHPGRCTQPLRMLGALLVGDPGLDTHLHRVPGAAHRRGVAEVYVIQVIYFHLVVQCGGYDIDSLGYFNRPVTQKLCPQNPF